MRLTKKIIEKAQQNAQMSGDVRIVVSEPGGSVWDTDDTQGARRYAAEHGLTIEARVRWDGTIERAKRTGKRRPK